jgi:hypothetical protein
MKKNISFVFLLYFFCASFISCKDNTINKRVTQTQKLFSPALEKIILNIINETNHRYQYPNSKKRLYSLSIFKKKDNIENCYLRISSDFYYDIKNIRGYSFINQNLIVFYNLEDSCFNDLINRLEIIQYKDSILGYKDYSFMDMEYETTDKIYKIISKDSLILIP